MITQTDRPNCLLYFCNMATTSDPARSKLADLAIRFFAGLIAFSVWVLPTIVGLIHHKVTVYLSDRALNATADQVCERLLQNQQNLIKNLDHSKPYIKFKGHLAFTSTLDLKALIPLLVERCSTSPMNLDLMNSILQTCEPDRNFDQQTIDSFCEQFLEKNKERMHELYTQMIDDSDEYTDSNALRYRDLKKIVQKMTFEAFTLMLQHLKADKRFQQLPGKNQKEHFLIRKLDQWVQQSFSYFYKEPITQENLEHRLGYVIQYMELFSRQENIYLLFGITDDRKWRSWIQAQIFVGIVRRNIDTLQELFAKPLEIAAYEKLQKEAKSFFKYDFFTEFKTELSPMLAPNEMPTAFYLHMLKGKQLGVTFNDPGIFLQVVQAIPLEIGEPEYSQYDMYSWVIDSTTFTPETWVEVLKTLLASDPEKYLQFKDRFLRYFKDIGPDIITKVENKIEMPQNVNIPM